MTLDAADLLRQAETYLTITHEQAARHDILGAAFTCSGCELRKRIAALLAQPAAPQSVPAAADLRERIAEALLDHLSRTADIRPTATGEQAFMPEVTDAERQRMADAVLAVLPESRRPFDAQAGLQRLADDLQRGETGDGRAEAATTAGRRERYAQAIREATGERRPTQAYWTEADAVVEVADAEQAGLRLQMGALAEDLGYVLGWTGPSHAHLAPGRWDKDGSPCLHCARLSLAQERLTAVRRMAAGQADRVLDERVAAAKEQPVEAGEAAHRPCRGDEFERWLKAQRDAAADYPQAYQAADGLLDLYRRHADTGTLLDQHVCEGQAVGDCDCLEQPAVEVRQAAEEEVPRPVHAVPLPGSNGISACCSLPPCEFVGERVTRDPDEVTCTGADEARQADTAGGGVMADQPGLAIRPMDIAHDELMARAQAEHEARAAATVAIRAGVLAEGWREAARFLRRTPRDSADFLGAIRGARLIGDELRRRAEATQQAGEPRAYLCRQHGDGQPGLTPLEADDLPDGGLCTECGVDVLIPQQQAGDGR